MLPDPEAGRPSKHTVQNTVSGSGSGVVGATTLAASADTSSNGHPQVPLASACRIPESRILSPMAHGTPNDCAWPQEAGKPRTVPIVLPGSVSCPPSVQILQANRFCVGDGVTPGVERGVGAGVVTGAIQKQGRKSAQKELVKSGKKHHRVCDWDTYMVLEDYNHTDHPTQQPSIVPQDIDPM